MSARNPAPTPTPTTFDAALEDLDLGALSFIFRHYPAEQAPRLAARIKLAAKLLTRVTELPHSKALEAVAQALRFQTWHQLSTHLTRAETSEAAQLPESWFDAVGGAMLLMAVAQDDVPMPLVQLEAFERFGHTLAMLTDAPLQHLLDSVCAGLCSGKAWADVRAKDPLRAIRPLYKFVVPDAALDPDGIGGYFDESAACQALTEELDSVWQGYGEFSKPGKRKARAWVEHALTLQPGFLEAGLALAWMQHEAGQAEASSTVNRFIRQSEALLPPGYRGRIAWGHVGNRFYHRMLWLRLKLSHEIGDLPTAAKVARKQLRLNPLDNLGVRYVLPLVLLEQGEHVAARRAAAKYLQGEHDLTAAAIGAFCEHALDNHAGFRRDLASALFSLPWLRTFLLNQRTPLPDGDDGFRTMRPDLETFAQFAWPAYGAVPGLRKSCEAFLAEPVVLQAEAELRAHWRTREMHRAGGGAGSLHTWFEMIDVLIDRVTRVRESAYRHLVGFEAPDLQVPPAPRHSELPNTRPAGWRPGKA